MTFISRRHVCVCLSLAMTMATPLYAGSTAGTTQATVTRFLAISRLSDLAFGTVSVSASAGSVRIDPLGNRYTSGGVAIDPADPFKPARFFIQGKPNAAFTVALPPSVQLKDPAGNAIVVDNIKSSLASGRLGEAGSAEIFVGGQINLKANQATGDYSGVLVVELHYS